MKKLLGLLLVVIVGFTACEGPEGPPGKDGTVTEWQYIDFVVSGNQWRLAGEPDEIGSYYYCTFDVPEITQAIYDDGLIICNFRYTDDTGANVQTTLPYTEYYVEELDGSLFAMQFSYSTTPTIRSVPGYIEFRITFSDFFTKEKLPPASCFFKLTLVY